MNKNWLKYLVAISAIMIAGSAAYFSVTGLGVLFSGAAVAVMIMAGSLEFAKLVTATYLKQEWDEIRGINKWYLTSAVVILMGITSAGIFGYLSNAFQQQNLKLEQVQREISVWENKIEYTNQQITTLQGQQKDLSTTQNTLITKGNVNSRLLRSVDNRDKQSNTINKKINTLQDSIVSYNGKINDVKNNNIEIEREVGGFRFVAEAFGVELKSVVKFFIILIVVVFDPLAVALVISFNQLVMVKKKDEDEVVVKSNPEDLKNFVDDSSRLRLSDEDLKKLEDTLLNPPPPNEKLKAAAKKYGDEVREKHIHINDFDETSVKSEPTQEERHQILSEMMKNDQELGLYDEPFDNPLIKEPYVSDDFTIGPDGAFEMTEEIQEELQKENEIDLKEVAEKLKDRELFPESNQRAKEIIENSDWDVTLMDGLEDEEPFFTEEEIEKILQEEPTEEEIQGNFSTIEPNSENIFQEEDYVPSLSDEEIMNMNQDEYERNLDMEDEFDGFVPEPFATPEEVEEFEIDETPVQSEPEVEKKNP